MKYFLIFLSFLLYAPGNNYLSQFVDSRPTHQNSYYYNNDLSAGHNGLSNGIQTRSQVVNNLNSGPFVSSVQTGYVSSSGLNGYASREVKQNQPQNGLSFNDGQQYSQRPLSNKEKTAQNINNIFSIEMLVTEGEQNFLRLFNGEKIPLVHIDNRNEDNSISNLMPGEKLLGRLSSGKIIKAFLNDESNNIKNLRYVFSDSDTFSFWRECSRNRLWAFLANDNGLRGCPLIPVLLNSNSSYCNVFLGDNNPAVFFVCYIGSSYGNLYKLNKEGFIQKMNFIAHRLTSCNNGYDFLDLNENAFSVIKQIKS